MVWRLIPAALATSDSVMDDQFLASSMFRMPSRIDPRRSTRDASAYGTRGAVRRSPGVVILATLDMIPVASLAQAGHRRAISTISKSDLAAPQSGQLQSSAMSSQ